MQLLTVRLMIWGELSMNRRTSVLICLVLAGILLPHTVSAQNARERENTVCEQRTARAAQVQDKVSEKTKTIQDRIAGIQNAAGIRRQEIDEVFTETQQEFNDRYKKWYDTYVESTDDEARQQAATTFYSQLQNLIAVRHEAQQQARNVYRAEVDKVRQQRFTDIRQQVLVFKEGSEAAFGSLATACNVRQRNNADVRAAFVGELQAARLDYAEKRRTYTSFKDQIQGATAARNQSFQDARKAFEVGFQEAISTLRQSDPSI